MTNKTLFFSALEDDQANIIKTSPTWRNRIASKLVRHYSQETIGQVSFYASFACLTLAVGLLGMLGLSVSFLVGLIGICGCLYGITKTHQRCKEYHQRDCFFEKIKWKTPPSLDHPRDKTRFATYNQAISFVVDDNIIWYAVRKHRALPPKWLPLYIPGIGDRKITQILADGENLMPRVEKDANNDEIFYKKVLKHKRQGKALFIQNLCGELDDIKYWFTLPIIHRFFPQYFHKKLIIPKDHAFIMANSGVFKQSTKDYQGNLQSVWEVTTGYELDGRYIILYDPYVVNHSAVKVSLPSCFELLRWDVSHSTIGLLGIEEARDGSKQYIVYTCKLDYDQLGLNPVMRYGYPGDSSYARILPMSVWQKHSVPSDFKEPVAINMTQTSIGDNAVEIKLITQSTLLKGCYVKNIGDNNFSFCDNIIGEEWHQYYQHQHLFRQNAKHSAQYEFEQVQLCGQYFSKLIMPSFQSHDLNVPLIGVTIQGEQIPFSLIMRKNMILAALGLGQPYWDLVPLTCRGITEQPIQSFYIEKKGNDVLLKNNGSGALYLFKPTENTAIVPSSASLLNQWGQSALPQVSQLVTKQPEQPKPQGAHSKKLQMG